jgi:hypothetical protein
LLNFSWLCACAHAVSWKSEQQLPIVYDPGYNITLLGLEKLHPFDSCKFSQVNCCYQKAFVAATAAAAASLL